MKSTPLDGNSIDLELIDLVQASWEKILPHRKHATAFFCEKLFELDPDLKRLFEGDAHNQARKMMLMLGQTVASLGRLEKVLPMLNDVAMKHIQVGAKEKDYSSVRSALIWTLEQGLAEAFTVDVRVAWNQTFSALVDVMQRASADLLMGECTD